MDGQLISRKVVILKSHPIINKVIIVLYIMLVLWLSITVNKVVNIDFQVEKNTRGIGSLYYDIGKGFSEENRINFDYKKENIKISINEHYIKSLRYDPLDNSGSIIIKKIQINNEKLSNEKLILEPLHSIKEIKNINKYGFEIICDGDDPYLLLHNNIHGESYDFDVNYLIVFFCLVILFLFLFKDKIKLDEYKRYNKNVKSFILIYILIFTIFTIFGYMYNLNYDIPDLKNMSKVLFFDMFIYEFVLMMLLLLLFVNKYKISLITAALLIVLYIAINISQFISFIISGEFITRLAMDNAESINLLLTVENISSVITAILFLFLLPVFITRYIIKNTNIKNISNSNYYIFFMLLYLLVINQNIIFIDSDIIKNRDELYKINYFTHSAPIKAFIKIHSPQKMNENFNFSSDELKILNDVGFEFNPALNYPLIKNHIYKTPLLLNRKIKKPNVILIFAEGLSARTSNVYSEKYKDLTPNINSFSKHKNSQIVTNYYNHTAATYRGLAGQLCSLYPKFGGVGGWDDNADSLPKIKYKCLPHVLANNGYENIYLNMLYEDYSGIDEMVSNFGFDKIMSSEELSVKYLNGINKLRTDRFTDHQSYNSLIGYLKDKESNKPFFISLYTSETHAWIDVGKDGKKYKKGKSNSLNTINNMDHAFGKFWNYFKNSKFSENTIVIFTTDHAHYYEKSYVKTMKLYNEDDYKKFFIDKIPLIIYDPTIKNSIKIFDANNATTIDLAPSIIHYLNLPNESNSFVGSSMFESEKSIGVASYGTETYIVKNNIVYNMLDVQENDRNLLELVDRYIRYMKELEVTDRVYND